MIYYVALYGGFLAVEEYAGPRGMIRRMYTMADARLATPFDSFDEADAAGKAAAQYLYPNDLRYFAVLAPVFA
jgi:hypothetical protein